jgi:Flp pilus assembly protein TadG
MRTQPRFRGNSDRGQIIVIFAGGLVTLMVIAALVIDLGFVFMIRRAEQNAADPGAIAAARYIQTSMSASQKMTEMRRAACFYARQNGFFGSAATNDGCTSVNDSGGAVLTVNWPPSTNAGPLAGNPGKVEVIIGRAHQSFLAGVVGTRQIAVTSSAIAAFDVNGSSNASSLIALDSRESCDDNKIHGSGGVNIHPAPGVTSGGFIQINATCSDGPANAMCDPSAKGALFINGNGTVTASQINLAGTCHRASTVSVSGPIVEGAPQLGDPLSELTPPKVSDYPAGQCGPSGAVTSPATNAGCDFRNAGTIVLQPGVYYGGWTIKNNVTLVLSAGMYIIAGGGVSLQTGGSITDVQGTSGPAPVMFYNTSSTTSGIGNFAQSTLDFSAQSTLRLRPIDSGPYKGIVIWNAAGTCNALTTVCPDVTMGGQTTLDVAGTMYSPKAKVTMLGGSGLGGANVAAVQIISWQFEVGGNAYLDMPYDPAYLYKLDEKGLVR